MTKLYRRHGDRRRFTRVRMEHPDGLAVLVSNSDHSKATQTRREVMEEGAGGAAEGRSSEDALCCRALIYKRGRIGHQ